jgi:hypothetical protein
MMSIFSLSAASRSVRLQRAKGLASHNPDKFVPTSKPSVHNRDKGEDSDSSFHHSSVLPS